MPQDERQYVGFWARFGAVAIDSILLVAIAFPLTYLFYGQPYLAAEPGRMIHGPADLIINWAFPAVATVVFWLKIQATPGKLVISARIIDATTGGPPTLRQCIWRYLGYIPATLAFGLGLLWVAFDKRKRGWHDMIAGTVVVRHQRGGRE